MFFLPLSQAFSSSLPQALDAATQLKLYKHKKWQALLHLKNEVPQISDPKFLLSHGQFSLEAELSKTLELAYTSPSTAVCRFPARLLFLSQYIDLAGVDLSSTANCPEFKKYLDFVPYSEVDLIFASEVLSSASSMMGHTFLKVSGLNSKSNHVSHSISFFTEFNTFNPFKLIYDGVIGGMKGFFIVRPYEIDLNQYAKQEGRNVWSYRLELDDYTKQLIKFHIWELKELEIEYLFQSYNCATLTLYILSIAEPELKKEEKLYVSPIDVVKAVEKYGMIKSKVVTLATDWELNMLAQEMDESLVAAIEALVLNDDTFNYGTFYEESFNFESLDLSTALLAKEYLTLLINKREIKEQITDEKFSALAKMVENLDRDKLIIDLAKYKDPVKSPQDSIISTNINITSTERNLDFTFLPAAHNLYDDNRQYFSESELKIGEIKLRANLDKFDIKLQSLTLYSVKSYLPSTNAASQFSGSFFMGYRHLLDNYLKEKGVAEFSGSFGKSTRIHKDVILYTMFGLGLAGNKKNGFAFVEPYLGTIINVVGDSKVIMEYRASYGQFGAESIKQTYSFQYAWYGFENSTFNFSIKSTEINDLRRSEVSLGLGYHF